RAAAQHLPHGALHVEALERTLSSVGKAETDIPVYSWKNRTRSQACCSYWPCWSESWWWAFGFSVLSFSLSRSLSSSALDSTLFTSGSAGSCAVRISLRC